MVFEGFFKEIDYLFAFRMDACESLVVGMALKRTLWSIYE